MDIKKIQRDAARFDLSLAEMHGNVTVCQTAKGNIGIEFDDGIFTLTTWGIDSEELCSGNLEKVVNVLAPLYIVEGV